MVLGAVIGSGDRLSTWAEPGLERRQGLGETLTAEPQPDVRVAEIEHRRRHHYHARLGDRPLAEGRGAAGEKPDESDRPRARLAPGEPVAVAGGKGARPRQVLVDDGATARRQAIGDGEGGAGEELIDAGRADRAVVLGAED